MSQPFIFIGTHTVREGKLEELNQAIRDLCELVETNEPRLIGFNAYLNEEHTELSVVQVHPDADSMAFHMQLVREHIAHAYEEVLDATTSIQIYGTPNEGVLEMIKQLAGSGVPLSVKPLSLGGFTRSAAEQAAVTS